MKRVSRGFISIEVLITLVVVIAGMTLGLQWLQSDSDQKINQAAAEHAKQITDAANRFIKDNYSTVVAAAAPLATYTPATISTYLPSNFNTTSPYGQTYSIRVYQPSANKLETMIVTTGGETIAETSLRKIAQLMGAAGGYVSSSNTAVAQGAYGGWQINFANYGATPGAGKLAMALFFQDESLVSDYLYRNAVPGHPELNQMNTPLNMRAQATENTSDALCVVGDTSTYGRIAVDGIGAVLSCQAGMWKRQGAGYWKDPVATYAALPASGNNLGDVRIVTGLSRAFTWNGSSWVGIAVDQNGNLTVPGTATINAMNGNLQVTAMAAEGAPCVGEARIASSTTSSGMILSCQAGVWKKLSGNALNTVAGGTFSGSVSGGTWTLNNVAVSGVMLSNPSSALRFTFSTPQPDANYFVFFDGWGPREYGSYVKTETYFQFGNSTNNLGMVPFLFIVIRP